MRKNFEKIFTSASIIIAVILIMVLLVTAFGGINQEDFDNDLVKALIITLAALYLVLAIVSLALMFINSDVIKDVVIRSANGGSMRVSSKVISKMAKKACAEIEGVKCKKIVLIQDDYGVRLKLDVKVVDKNVVETEIYIRTLLEDMYLGEFGFKFSSIEIKIMALTPNYKPDVLDIEARVKESVEAAKQEEAAHVSVEAASGVTDTANVMAESAKEAPASEPAQEENKTDNAEGKGEDANE